MIFDSRKKLNTAKNSSLLIQKLLGSGCITADESLQLYQYQKDIFSKNNEILTKAAKKKNNWYHEFTNQSQPSKILENLDYNNICDYTVVILQELKNYLAKDFDTNFQSLPLDKQYVMLLWQKTLLNYSFLDAYKNYENYKLGLTAVFLSEIIGIGGLTAGHYLLGGALLAMIGVGSTGGLILLAALIAIAIITLVAIVITIHSHSTDLKTSIGTRTQAIENFPIKESAAESNQEDFAQVDYGPQIKWGEGALLVFEKLMIELHNLASIISSKSQDDLEHLQKIQSYTEIVDLHVSNIRLGM